ncbi:MAG: D-2-hydroxyacid dehydrogenase [Planctomycetota bacterium]|nr:D-2-hydroxyacid dehydrogenase [Planctomycetota bacterium]
MKIVVLDGKTLNPGDNPWDAVEKLGELTVYDRTADDEILQRAAGAEVLLTNKTPLSAETLEQLDSLRFISVLATGYNVVDVEAAGRRGVVVSNVPIYATDSVAQFTFAMLLELCHHVGSHDSAVKAGRWAESGNFCFWDFPLVELAGKKMGIVGFGRIGRRVGELAHAFGMEVLAADVNQVNPPEYEPFQWVEVEELFTTADVVSLHCPQTSDNVGMVNRELLGRMKAGAFLINTSRGGLIVEADLAGALNAGQIAGAALDVVSTEPIKPDNPLLSAQNCLITPHIAWAALAARRRLMATTAENIAAFVAGKPINVVS